MFRQFVSTGAALALAAGCASFSRASAFDARPKLVVVLVIDQFRGDYLDRYRGDFKTENGFNLFLKQGAYFPNCYYEYANTETAPGHSTIGTGAYSDGHNIANNQWWDLSRSSTRQVTSVEDADFPLVGATVDAALGASPHNELASTLGDELVLSTGGKARVFGVSLKDRAAILTSGHATKGAFWIDHPTGKWVSSTYWGRELPGWVRAFNGSGRTEAAWKASGLAKKGEFYETVGATPAGVQYELEFAKALVEAEKLGHDDVTDVLTVSLSSTDILGHRVGPDAPEQRALIDAMDGQLDGFFTWLGQHVDGGLSNVWVSLTGDHGVAPRPAVAAAEGMPAGTFPLEGLISELNRRVSAKLTPTTTGAPARFVLGGTLPILQLNPDAFAQVHVGEADAERMVADMLPEAMAATQQAEAKNAGKPHMLRPVQVRHAYPKTQIAAGELPDTDEGHRILHSYTTMEGWWVLMTPGMYSWAGSESSGSSHGTPYSYDRHVPLAFFGGPFVPGTYLQHAEPVDIAATFAGLLRVNRPSACVGRVVTEALRPEPVR